MTTGKVEYAPDYKGKSGFINCRTVFGEPRAHERRRLEQDVVRAAREWRAAGQDMARTDLYYTECVLLRAIDALEAHE